MVYEYDGCSDDLYEAGTELLRACPSNDSALKYIRAFIAEYCLTKDDVKIIKNKNAMSLIAKIDLTLTILHKGDTSHE